MSPLLMEATSQSGVVRAPLGLRSARARQVPDRRNRESRLHLIWRVQCEFREMPGLHLTLPQAARLFGLDLPTCQRLLSEAMSVGWLRLTPLGTYVLAGPEP